MSSFVAYRNQSYTLIRLSASINAASREELRLYQSYELPNSEGTISPVVPLYFP